MVQMALAFVAVSVLVLLLLAGAAVYYVPRALDTGHGDDGDGSADDSGGPVA